MFNDKHEPSQVFTPYITYGIICLNILVFLYELWISPIEFEALLKTYGSIPKNVLQLNRSYTLVTSQFLHSGLFHLIANLLVFWLVGADTENLIGHIKFLGAYLLAGVVGYVVHAIIIMRLIATQYIPAIWVTVPSIGASGAIFGIITIYTRNYYNHRFEIKLYDFNIEIKAWTVVLTYLVVTAAIAVNEGPAGTNAFGAHIGGFIMGFLISAAWNVLHGKKITSSPASRSSNQS